MGQPHASGGSKQDECPACPECHSQKTALTMATSHGVYCRCRACGYVWHHDRDAKAQETP